jgi:hypothetical protein
MRRSCHVGRSETSLLLVRKLGDVPEILRFAQDDICMPGVFQLAEPRLGVLS